MAFLWTLALICAGISLFATGTRARAEALTPQTPPLSARIETLSLSDEVFGRTRTLRVWLPAGYDPRTTTYPVLYLLDGQNLFDAKLSSVSGQEWQVDETAQALINAGTLPPMIVVGIDNAPDFGRAQEYLPWPDSAFPNPEQRPVKGARLPDFLRESVIPFIEARYRVDATKRGLGGSSYGGLASLYVALHAPDLFSRLLVESPSLHVADMRLLREIELLKAPLWPQRLYIGMGEREASGLPCQPAPSAFDQKLISATHRLQRLLTSQGLDQKRLKVVLEPCATHSESAWAKRLGAALGFLYAAPAPAADARSLK